MIKQNMDLVHYSKKLKDPGTCRVFFSSPFGGMEEEREELTRKYFPQLHHFCHLHGVQFVAVDMRWGITSEASENAQVINICLRELDRSDIFVGFFGQRYGWHGADDKSLQDNFDNALGRYPWLDSYRDKSVTELEFLHGHLNQPGKLPACILFRDETFDNLRRTEGEKKGDKKQVFKYSPESEHSSMLMDDLKSRVQMTEHKTLGIHMDYKAPEEGARLMFEAVWNHMTDCLLTNSESQNRTQRDLDLALHNAFLASRCALYLTSDVCVSALDANLSAETPDSMLITGEAGIGKSALLCNWIQKLKHVRENYLLAYHFVGCAEGSTDISGILRRIISEFEDFVKNSTGQDNQPDQEQASKSNQNDDTKELMRQLQVAVEKVIGLAKVPIIVIDGLEKVVSPSKIGKHLYWIPTAFPHGTVIVVSTQSTDTETLQELETNRKYQLLHIQPLDMRNKEELCVRSLKESGKELSPSQLQRVVDAKQTENPLFLKIVLSELCLFGYFRLLDQKIDSLISAESVEELFHQFLKRLEDDYNVKEYPDNLVEQVMCCIYLSHQGLSETELKDIFGIPSHIWSPLFFAIEKFVVDYSGLLKYGFTELKEAVMRKYLQNEDLRKHYLQVLIKYFNGQRKNLRCTDLNQPITKRPTYELPWLFRELGDKKGLIDVISDLLIFIRMESECKYDLLDFWKYTCCSADEVSDLLLASFDRRIVDVYLHMEDKQLLSVNTPPGLNIESFLRVIEEFLSLAEYQTGREKICKRHLQILTDAAKKLPQRTDLAHQLYQSRYKLACLYVDTGRYDEAESLHKQVLEYHKITFEDAEPNPNNSIIENLGFSYHGLGLLYYKQDKFELAEEHLHKSIELHERIGNSSQIAASFSNMGIIRLNSHDYHTALEYSSKALKIYEEINFGHLPPIIGNLLTNIGLCYRRLGNLDEADRMYKKSLEIKVNAVGQEHQIVALAYLNLGTLEMYRNDWNKSENYIKESLRIFQVCGVPRTDEDYMKVQENYLLTQLRQNRYCEIVDQFLELFENLVKLKQMNHCNPYVHTEMVKFFINNQRHEEALKVTWALLNSNVREAVSYVHLDYLDMLLPLEERPKREREFTLDYALEQWPGTDMVVHRKAVFHLIPEDDVQGVVDLIEEFHANSSCGTEAFDCGIVWSSEGQNEHKEKMIIQLCQAALKHYPNSSVYIDNMMRSYRRQQKPSEALDYAVRLTELEPNDPRNFLIAAETATLAGDLVMAKKFFTQTQEKFGDNDDAVQRAQNGLGIIAEALKDDDKGEDVQNGKKDGKKEENETTQEII